MINIKKRNWLKLIASSLLISNLLASPVLAEEDNESIAEEETTETTDDSVSETETTETTEDEEATEEETVDLFGIGESNPYSEEELLEEIQLDDSYEDGELYELNEPVTALDVVYQLMYESVATETPITIDQVNQAIGEATHISQTGNSEFHTYAASDDLITQELVIQYYEESDGFQLSNIELTQTIPATFEELDITEEELIELVESASDVNDLLNVLGAAHTLNYTLLSDTIIETITWVDNGHIRREMDGNLTTDIREITLINDPTSDTIDYEIAYIETEETENSNEEDLDENNSEETESESE